MSLEGEEVSDLVDMINTERLLALSTICLNTFQERFYNSVMRDDIPNPPENK